MAFVLDVANPLVRSEATIGGDPRPEHALEPARARPQGRVGREATAGEGESRKNEAAQKEACQQAEQRGYAEGLQRGHDAGLVQAQAEVEAQLVDARANLEAATKALAEPWKAMRGDIADAIVESAVHLARAMVGQLPDMDPVLMQRIVEEILDEASGMGGGGHAVRFRVHPANQPNVTHWTAACGAEVAADDRLGRADVLAEWVGKDGDPMNRIDWDASLEGRWRAIRRALGLAQQEP